MLAIVERYRSRKAARAAYENNLAEFVRNAGTTEYKLNDVLPFPHKGQSVSNAGFLKQLIVSKGKDDTIVGVEVWRVIQEIRRPRAKRVWAEIKMRFSNWQHSSIPDYIRRNRELFD